MATHLLQHAHYRIESSTSPTREIVRRITASAGFRSFLEQTAAVTCCLNCEGLTKSDSSAETCVSSKRMWHHNCLPLQQWLSGKIFWCQLQMWWNLLVSDRLCILQTGRRSAHDKTEPAAAARCHCCCHMRTEEKEKAC